MNDKAILLRILRNRQWIIFIALTVAIISGFYYFNRPDEFQSSVTFFIDNNEGNKLGSGDVSNLISSNFDDGNRLYNLAKSTELFDSLITKFNLYDHYHIDKSNLHHYEIVTGKLNKNIGLQFSPYGSLQVIVTDFDRDFAAFMANEIFIQLNEINKHYVIQKIAKRMKIYESLIKSNKEESTEQMHQMEKLITECNVLVDKGNAQKLSRDLVYDLKQKTMLLSAQLSSVNDELLKSIKIYGISATAIEKENIPDLKLINKALPDTRHLWVFIPLKIIGWTLGAVAVMIGILILIHEISFGFKQLYQ